MPDIAKFDGHLKTPREGDIPDEDGNDEPGMAERGRVRPSMASAAGAARASMAFKSLGDSTNSAIP